MSNHKFTDDEIIKALECCLEDVANCNNCPYERYCDMHENNMLRDTLALINRQKAEIERLKNSRDRWKQIATDFDKASRETEKEFERLTAERDNEHRCYLHICDDLKQSGVTAASAIAAMQEAGSKLAAVNRNITAAKAEAIKEFAENVKAIFECVLYFDDDVKECILNEIDTLVKEMPEEWI